MNTRSVLHSTAVFHALPISPMTEKQRTYRLIKQIINTTYAVFLWSIILLFSIFRLNGKEINIEIPIVSFFLFLFFGYLLHLLYQLKQKMKK